MIAGLARVRARKGDQLSNRRVPKLSIDLAAHGAQTSPAGAGKVGVYGYGFISPRVVAVSGLCQEDTEMFGVKPMLTSPRHNPSNLPSLCRNALRNS